MSGPVPRHSPSGRELLVAAALYAQLCLLFFRPLVLAPGEVLGPDLGDPVLNLYLLSWVSHQVSLGLPDLWNAPFFFPSQGTLTLSDHLLGPGLLTAAVEHLGRRPLLAYNLLFLGSFLLSGLFTFALLRRLGLRSLPALLGGAFYAFSAFRMSQTPHLQVLLMQWIPPALWLWDRLLEKPSWRRAAAFLGVYLLHISGGSYLALMLHFGFLALTLNRLWSPGAWGLWTRPRSLLALGTTATLAAALLAGLYAPYLQVAADPQRTRGLANFPFYGATALAYLTPASYSPYRPWMESWIRPLAPAYPGGDGWLAEKSLFPGFLGLALAVLGAVALWRRYRTPRRSPLPLASRIAAILCLGAAAACVAAPDLFHLRWAAGPHALGLSALKLYRWSLIGLVLALIVFFVMRRRAGGGPWLLWREMPLLGRGLFWVGVTGAALSLPLFWVPIGWDHLGLSMIRVPTRFYALTSLALALFVARGAQALLDRLPRRQVLAGGLLLAAFALDAFPTGMRFVALPAAGEMPPVTHWIAARDDVRAYLELPLLGTEQEVLYMYRSTVHWKPLVNGFSGFFPPTYLHLREICCWPVPDEEVLATLRSMGVSHLLVHSGELRKRWAKRSLKQWVRQVEAGEVAGVRKVYEDAQGDLVFDLGPPADPA